MNKYDITDAELELMQVLWENKRCSLRELLAGLNTQGEKNVNTVKTLLRRLMLKGAVTSEKVNLRDVVYVPRVKKDQYLQTQNHSFLQKLYHGSTEELLRNFVENKQITREELQNLLDLLESEDR